MSEEKNQAIETGVQNEGVSKILYVNGTPIEISPDLDLSYVAANKYPDFQAGDTIKLNYKIIEGDKERTQLYEGIVICIRGEGLGKTFIVRRISHEVGVERIFPYYSPSIQSISIVRKGKIRRAKLFYLRDKSGKDSRIKEAYNMQHQIEVQEKLDAQKAKLEASNSDTENFVEKEDSGAVKKVKARVANKGVSHAKAMATRKSAQKLNREGQKKKVVSKSEPEKVKSKKKTTKKK